jgi:acetyltransferase-like isoleucine patch superfamily enzyme
MNKLIGMLRKVPRLVSDIWLGCIQNMPGPLGFDLRYKYWKKRLKRLGNGARIDVGVYFQQPAYISIENNAWIDRGVIVLAGPDPSTRQKKKLSSASGMATGEVMIGKNVHIGPYVVMSGIDAGISIGDDCGLSSGVRLYAFSHHYRFFDAPGDTACAFGPMVDHSRQCLISGAILLEENVGVALNAVILPGVRIGKNSFVCANSMLFDQTFDQNSLIAGSPAKKRGSRFVGGHE